MKWVAVILLTIFISSLHCGYLNRITKKHALITEENGKSLIEDDMQKLVTSPKSNTIDVKPKDVSTTEETTDYSDEASFLPYCNENDDPDKIIECAYGTPKFPIPKPEVNKYAGKDRRRIADIKCEEQILDVKYNIFDVAKNNLICRSRLGIATITGRKTVQNQFSHMGAVGWIDKDNQPLFFCGSTLISSKFSVTAAHCRSVRGNMNLISPYPKFVRFGSVNIMSTENMIDVNIDAFLTLPEFDANPLMKYNDIALIRFTEDIKFSYSLRPACVWHKSMDDLTTGNVTGLSQTRSRNVSFSYAEVNILKHENCSEQTGNRKFRHWQGLTDKQFCAGTSHGSGDTCQGDGPLLVQEPFEREESITVYYLVGIISFGFECGKPEVPDIYTKVNKYLCFIEEHVWPSTINHFCP